MNEKPRAVRSLDEIETEMVTSELVQMERRHASVTLTMVASQFRQDALLSPWLQLLFPVQFLRL